MKVRIPSLRIMYGMHYGLSPKTLKRGLMEPKFTHKVTCVYASSSEVVAHVVGQTAAELFARARSESLPYEHLVAPIEAASVIRYRGGHRLNN